MKQSLAISPRFCGPASSGNGGYVCGRVATYLGGSAEVTLRRPVPLRTSMTVERRDADSIQVHAGDGLIAEGVRLPEGPAVEVPGPVPVSAARAAGARSRFRVHPDKHPFPTCFVCGPERMPGDGLRILVGRVRGLDVSADVWSPDETLAETGGYARPEFVWAALDCAGGIGAVGDDEIAGPPYVLGRLSATLIAPVTIGQPHVVLGWRLTTDGRKITAGSAVVTAAGEPVALARATWIRLADRTRAAS